MRRAFRDANARGSALITASHEAAPSGTDSRWLRASEALEVSEAYKDADGGTLLRAFRDAKARGSAGSTASHEAVARGTDYRWLRASEALELSEAYKDADAGTLLRAFRDAKARGLGTRTSSSRS